MRGFLIWLFQCFLFAACLAGGLWAAEKLAGQPLIQKNIWEPFSAGAEQIAPRFGHFSAPAGLAFAALFAVLLHALGSAWFLRRCGRARREVVQLRQEREDGQRQCAAAQAAETHYRQAAASLEKLAKQLQPQINQMAGVLRSADSAAQFLRQFELRKQAPPKPDSQTRLKEQLKRLQNDYDATIRHWRKILAALPVRIALIHADGRVRYCNQRAANDPSDLDDPRRLLRTANGQTLPELRRLYAHSNMMPDTLQRILENLGRGAVQPWEIMFARPTRAAERAHDDLRNHFEFLTPLRWEDGTPGGILVSVDVSDWKRALERKGQTERDRLQQQFERVCEYGRVGLFHVELPADARAPARLLPDNEVMAQLLGRLEQTDIWETGAPLAELLAEPDKFHKFVQDLRGGKHAHSAIWAIRPPDPSAAPRFLQVTAAYREEQQCLVGAAIDISERVRAEQRSHALRKELIELNRDLAAVERRECERISDKLHDEVCNPLTRLGLRLAGLARDLPKQAAEQVQTIHEFMQPIVNVTADVHNALRPREQHGGLDRRIADLSQYMKVFYGLTLHVRSPRSLPRFDPREEETIYAAVRETLFNIGKHAYPKEFTGERAATVTVDASPGAAANAVELTLAIEDRGRGLEEETRLRLEQRLGRRFLETPLKCAVQSQQGQGTKVRVSGRLAPRAADAGGH